MPFNTALSGIRAANDDLRLTGNNIANASTTGFKESRAEFGDIYSTSLLGSGANQIGSGVRVQSVAQQFSQGNISFTDNVLDMAVSGSGFFVTSLNGDQSFTRAGAFSLDKDGYMINNVNARLQGFIADGNGNLGNLWEDIRIESNNLQPQTTAEIIQELNLDSRELPPQTAYNISAARITDYEAGAGTDITIGITDPTGIETSLTIATAAGADTAASIMATLDAATGVEAVSDGNGGVDIVLVEGYSLTTNQTVAAADALTGTTTTAVNNGFDPTDPSTYSHSTAVTIYDSLGNPHVMRQYFIKQPYDPSDAGNRPANHWQMAVQVDNRDVGAPIDPNDPVNTATEAVFDVYFNTDGTMDEVATGDINITNWTPLDGNGNQLGALGPGGTPNSDFLVTMNNTTQVGSEFEVREVSQDGTAAGRLAGISIDEEGVIFARYSNGQNRVLAQIVLADFSNNQGLQSLGDTSWAETSSSGNPIIGAPGTSSLGLVQSGALEGSNVDLSEQLVNLIIAQRNFQASAKTIETADQTTQTIINLR